MGDDNGWLRLNIRNMMVSDGYQCLVMIVNHGLKLLIIGDKNFIIWLIIGEQSSIHWLVIGDTDAINMVDTSWWIAMVNLLNNMGYQ